MLREWVVVCDAADHPACLAGWEVPANGAGSDARRRFETIWSVDPRVVHSASRICAALATGEVGVEPILGDEVPGSVRPRGLPAAVAELVTGAPAPASPDLLRAGAILDRMLAYLDGA